MPLDSNFFVLLVRPRTLPGWIDFVRDDALGEVLYSAQRVSPSAADLFLSCVVVQHVGRVSQDSTATSSYTLSEPLTATAYGTLSQPPPSLPNATQPNPKLRSITLDSPRVETKLHNVGRLSWEWEFEWQETTYVWTRDVVGLFGNERGYTLSVSRRPDPNYPVVTFHPRKKGGSIEIYDHNLARVEPAIDDKKGLEVTLLLSLCFFLDSMFPVSSAAPSPGPPLPPPRPSASTSAPPRRQTPTGPQSSSHPEASATRRNDSPRLLATNEIRLESDSDQALAAHSARCLSLLEDQTLLYVVLTTKSSEPNLGASLVKLAEEVKRKRYKASGEELKLFVDDSGGRDDVDRVEGGRQEEDLDVGTRLGSASRTRKTTRIGAYTPPRNLRIYLSRLELSDVLPNYQRRDRQTTLLGKEPVLRPPINFDHDNNDVTRPESTTGDPSSRKSATEKKDGRSWFGR